ncbi:hypothetical protein ACIBG8_48985 [Nonomuraea sp. NPDC050556]|uniref:hypothetical protein n=1 Tax=Nonomuraea sp. NPDC050556 TaxID=3364369 RepID=UPI00378804B3
MAMKARRVTGATAILLALISGCGTATGGVVPQPPSAKSNPTVDKLLLSFDEIPKVVVSQLMLGSQNPDVQKLGTLDLYGSSAYRLRSWSDRDGRHPIAQVIYQFPTAEAAASDYLKRPYGGKFNFDEGIQATVIENTGMEIKAESARLFCVAPKRLGNPLKNCPQWGSRAQYGKFIVDTFIRRFDGRRDYIPVPEETFRSLVAAVDRHVATQVGD